MVRDKRYKRLIIISRLLFVAYMVFALYFLLFAETFGRGSINRGYSYNLELFREIRRYMEWSSKSQLGMKMMFLNIWGNIIIFMPFGFFIPTVVKKAKNIVIVTILSFVFSVSVEVTQLLTKAGSFDVDDLLLNTIGGAIGYILYVAAKKWLLGRNKN